MAGLNNNLIDLIKYLRGKQRYIVSYRLQSIGGIKILFAMSKHSTNLVMIIGHVVHFVVVPIAVQPHGSQNQYLPKIHARSAGLMAFSWHNLFKNLKDFVSYLGCAVDVLQSH